MTTESVIAISSDVAWLIAVPKRAEFSQPDFHFGERCQWFSTSERDRHDFTGRITGMWFSRTYGWEYLMNLDRPLRSQGCLEEEAVVNQSNLTLILDRYSIRNQLKPTSEWLFTSEAAQSLGISPDHLRHLRLKGLFKSGYHCRDTSLPGSARPCWQWHVERCHEALEISRLTNTDS